MEEPADRLVEACREFDAESLRDVRLFDQATHRRLYARDDVADAVADLDVGEFVDNERYGYVTRDTYDQLYYADYEYTVRGSRRSSSSGPSSATATTAWGCSCPSTSGNEGTTSGR